MGLRDPQARFQHSVDCAAEADGAVAAEAALTLADVPQEILANANVEALGWRVDSNDE